MTFNGAAASFTVDSDTQITATVPSEGTTGKIAVTTPGGTGQSSKDFKVKPAISIFSLLLGSVGTPVTLSGSGFLGTTDVSFNGVAATFTVVNSGVITTTVPAGATSGKISVTNAGGTVMTDLVPRRVRLGAGAPSGEGMAESVGETRRSQAASGG